MLSSDIDFPLASFLPAFHPKYQTRIHIPAKLTTPRGTPNPIPSFASDVRPLEEDVGFGDETVFEPDTAGFCIVEEFVADGVEDVGDDGAEDTADDGVEDPGDDTAEDEVNILRKVVVITVGPARRTAAPAVKTFDGSVQHL